MLWSRFAQAVLAEPASDASPTLDAATLAAAFQNYPAERAYDREVGARLFAMLSGNQAPAGDARALAQAVASFVNAVSVASVRRLLVSFSTAETRDVVLTAADALPAATVVKLLGGAAEAGESPLSPAALALLHDLAGRAAHSTEADRAVRAHAHAHVGRWFIASTGMSDDYDAGAGATRSRAATVQPEPERIVQTCLEIGSIGPAVWQPVAALLEAGRASELLAMMKEYGRENRAVAEMAHVLATPTRLRELLQADEPDFEAIDLLLADLGLSAARVLLDELIESKSRVTRRGILDRLSAMGRALGPLLVERLKDPRWFVQRNMLSLLREIAYLPENLPLDTYLEHGDARVRREALQLMMSDRARREEALRMAVDDPDPHTVRMGLLAAREDCPPSVVPVVVKRLSDPTFPSFLRVPAVRLLQGSRSAFALDALLTIAGGGRGLFGGAKLGVKSPEMLSALTGLAANWSSEKRAAELIDQARKSKDGEVRGAVAAARQGP